MMPFGPCLYRIKVVSIHMSDQNLIPESWLVTHVVFTSHKALKYFIWGSHHCPKVVQPLPHVVEVSRNKKVRHHLFYCLEVDWTVWLSIGSHEDHHNHNEYISYQVLNPETSCDSS
jgi:hypothetical protein